MNTTVNMDKVMVLSDMSDLTIKCVHLLHAIFNDQPKTVIIELAVVLLKEIQSIISEINVDEEIPTTE